MSAPSALSREIGAVRPPKSAFRSSLPVWSQAPVAPYDHVYVEVFEVPGQILSTAHLSKPHTRAHCFGRNADWCDQALPKHPSISRQHAALIHSKQGPVIVDLYGMHGTFLNEVRLQAGRPYLLFEGDTVKFGSAPLFYKFKGTGREKRSDSDKIEPIGSSEESAEESVEMPATSSSSSSNDKGAGEKRSRESGESESRKSARTESSKHASSSSSSFSRENGLADPKRDRIRCLHLLVKHSKSRRPSSWREAVITISLAEAKEKLEGLRKSLLPYEEKGDAALAEAFASLAQTNSDCSSAKKGGELGFFTFDKMQPPFSKAAFELKVGQMSGLVETDSGVHIILRRE